jgi:hypothetical protein
VLLLIWSKLVADVEVSAAQRIQIPKSVQLNRFGFTGFGILDYSFLFLNEVKPFLAVVDKPYLFC